MLYAPKIQSPKTLKPCGHCSHKGPLLHLKITGIPLHSPRWSSIFCFKPQALLPKLLAMCPLLPPHHPKTKGTLLGTPNREPQEYSRYIIGIYLPGSLYSIIFLLYSWGSLFGVPSRIPSKTLTASNQPEAPHPPARTPSTELQTV